MWVRSLELRNFRNFLELTVEFEKHLNFIQGDNGVGKTNLIDAIYFLSMARSFKKSKDQEMIRFSSSKLTCVAKVVGLAEEKSIAYEVDDKSKTFYLNGNKQKVASALIGQLPLMAFGPENVTLFKGPPAGRRKLLDLSLGQSSADYLYALGRYNKVRKDRDLLLKDPYLDKDYLKVLNNQLVNSMYRIAYDRYYLIKELNVTINSIFKRLTSEDDSLELTYLHNLEFDDVQEYFMEKQLKKLEQTEKEDRLRGMTTIGIHKDDLQVSLNGMEIGAYGSQGQNRLASIALTLALTKRMESLNPEKVVLLLDDVLSDLDETHQKRLIDELENYGQVFITLAQNIHSVGNAAIYDVSDDFIRRRK